MLCIIMEFGLFLLIKEKERCAFLDMDYINEDIEKQKARNKYNEIVKK